METYYKAVNWNAIEDVVDKATWEKLTEQFWLDTRIPLSNDLDDWRKLSQKEKDLVGKVFGGLTLLDTLQSVDGVSAIRPDVRTPHEEAVLNNIEFMECYTKDHQILTIDRGWVPINLIKEGDIVLAYDKETETTRFEKVLKTSKHLAPHIERIYNSNIDLRVSPGHRMLFEETSIKYGRITEAWKSYKTNVITAEEFVKLPQTAYYRIPLVRPYINPNKIKRLSTFEKLLIAFQADGSITEREIKRIKQYRNKDSRLKTDTFTIRFNFSKEKKIEKLLGICKDLNILCKEIKPSASFNKTKLRRNFNVFIPFKLLGSFDMKPKLFNNWFSLSEFNETKAQQFIEELALWDSHIHQNNDGSRGYISYYTKEQENANFVKAITTLAGYIYNSGVNKDNRSKNYSDSHFVRILSSENQKNVQLQSLYFEKLEGEEVYGIEVPSQFLVVSAGNKTIISGNCVHAKSYSSIFSTLNTKTEIEQIFEWTANNKHLQKKAEIIKDVYDNGTPLQKKVASVFLESFLFYSGFFTPLWYLGNNKLPNVAEIIKLIIRDECLISEHSLLTPNGWKSVSEIKIGDLVAQFNKDSRELSFAKVQHTSIHMPDKTYKFKTEQNHLSLHCSPNHRILGYYNDNPVIQKAKEFKKGSKHIPNTGEFIGVDCEPLTLEERFLIALHADGSYYRDLNKSGKLTRNGQKKDTIPVKFSFRKERKIDEFEKLLSELNYEFTKTKDKKIIKNHKTRYWYNVRVPIDLVDKNRIKKLPTRNFTKINKQWCEDYIHEISKWDGHVVKENKSRITYGTTDPDAAELVQTIATLAGYRTHYTVRKDNRKDSYNDIHRVQITRHRRSTSTQRLIMEEAPSQKVYGVQVPDGFILTKHNDSISVTGNSVHGTYIGYKFQLAFNELPENEQEELKEWMYNLLYTLYENEERYTEELYDEIGWTEEVKTFLRYNANKALMNLGQDPLFPEGAEDVNPIIMNGISTGTSNHDFFSQVGNGYLLGEVEAMEDDDYNYGKDI